MNNETLPRGTFEGPEYTQARIKSEMEQLEAILDRGTLMGLLEQLSMICGEKAAHLESNWGESGAVWTRAANAIDKLAASKAITGVLPS